MRAYMVKYNSNGKWHCTKVLGKFNTVRTAERLTALGYKVIVRRMAD